jgi:N-acetylglutamate synthase-like GNAT family acetyltransferase
MQIIDLNACPLHIHALAAWHHSEWSHFNPSQTLEQRIDKMHMYLTPALIPSTWVAIDDDGSLLGSAALIEQDLNSRPDLGPWLASVYVDAAQRGYGIGRQLVQHVMDQVRNAGIDRFYLFTPDRARFYAHMGWSVVEKRDHHGLQITVMHIEFK